MLSNAVLGNGFVDSITNTAGSSLQSNNSVEHLPHHDQRPDQYEEVEADREAKLHQQPTIQQNTQHTVLVEKFLLMTDQPETLNIKYKTLNDETKKTFYFGIFIKIGRAVQIGDIDTIKKLDGIVSYVNIIEKQKGLPEKFYKDDSNPIKSSNLIILACEHNRPEVLNYLFKQKKVLNNLFTAIEHSQVRIVDVDKKGHTAVYYAIRSNNVDLLRTLISATNFFHDLCSTKLHDLLFKDYVELKLRNVEISEMMQIFVEERLIRERFFREILGTNDLTTIANKKAQGNSLKKIDVIYKQIEMIFTAINDLIKLLDKEEAVDSDLLKTLYIARYIALSIRILKRKLKLSYNQLPWEEIEFYLSRFPFFPVLERKNLHRDLINFIDRLSRVFDYSNDSNNNKINRIKNKIKKYINSGVPRNREKVSGFESLYADYELIKDPYSLNKMSYYIELALSVSAEEQSGQLIIQRALQIIGEYLKNSPRSPHLSDSIEYSLIEMRTATIMEIAPSLRNLLSHNDNLNILFSRNNIEKEKGFFTQIQDDLRKVLGVITKILYNVKMEQYKKRYEDIISKDHSKEVKELTSAFINKIESEKNELVDNKTHISDALNKIENLITKIRQKIDSKVESENQTFKPPSIINLQAEHNNQELFTKINTIIASEKNKITDIRENYKEYLEIMRLMTNYFKMSLDSGHGTLETMHYQCFLHLITQKKTSTNLREIIDLVEEISHNIKGRDENAEILNLVREIEYIIHLESINTNKIEAFKERLGTLEIDFSVHDRMKSELDDVLSTFKNKVKNAEEYQKLESALEKQKQISIAKFKLNDHVKGKNKLIEKEYNSLVEALDETENKKKELLDCFNFKVDTNQGKRLMKKSQDHFGNFLLEKNKFDKLVQSLQFNESDQKVLKDAFDEENSIHKDDTTESLLEFIISNIKVKLKGEVYNELIEKLENKKQAHEAKQILSNFFEHQNNSDIKAIDYNYAVDMLDTTDTNKQKLYKLYPSPFNKAVLAVESLNDSYGNFIHAVAKTETTVNDLYNSFNKLSESLQLEFKSQELLKKIFKEKKVEILENHFSEKLSLLKRRLENINCGSKHELISYYKHNNKFQVEVEMLLLDLSNTSLIINQPPFRYSEKEFLSVNEGFPFLMMASLRNYLAHGDALIESLPFDPSIAVITNALIFVDEGESIIALRNLVKDSKMKGYLIDMINNNIINELKKEELPIELQQHGESIIRLQQSDYWIDYLVNILSIKGKGTSTTSCIVESDIGSLYDKNFKLLISQKELFVAVKQNNKEKLDNCLKRGDEIDAKDSKMQTPLHIAARNGHKDVVEILLNNGANVNVADIERNTPLHYASLEGYSEIVEVLLNQGAEVDTENEFGYTPLHHASESGYKKVVEILSSHNADINFKRRDGSIPLHCAACSNNMELIIFFVEKEGTNVNTKNEYGHTPLCSAILAKHNKVAVVNYLLEKGAIVNCEDINKCTPLHIAVWKGDKDIVETLLNNGANVDSIDDNEYTPLHLAAQMGHDQIIDVLLNKRVNINAKNVNGMTPFLMAAVNLKTKTAEHLFKKGSNVDVKDDMSLITLHAVIDNLDMVKFFITIGGFDINALDKYDRTPLHYAVSLGNLDVIEFLVKNGAIVNAPDKDGYTPIYFLRNFLAGNMGILKYLIVNGANLDTSANNGATLIHHFSAEGYLDPIKYIVGEKAKVNVYDNDGITPLHFAAMKGNLNVITFLISEGADVNASDNKGNTPLHWSAKYGHNAVIKILLDNGAEIDAKGEDDKTALHLSAGIGYIKVVNTLLKEKKDKDIVNVPDKNKMTPLSAASKRGYKNIVEILFKNGANLNIPNKCGITPLHIAVEYCSLRVVKFLVVNGANVDTVNNNQITPLHYAIQCGCKDIIKVLLENGANVNVADSNNVTPLHLAIYKGDYQTFNILLKHAKKVFPDKLSKVVNAVAEIGLTPLHFAAHDGYYEMIKTLLSSKVDVDAVDNHGFTALNIATVKGYLKIVNILLQNGANVNSGTNEKVTPLHYASSHNYVEITKILLNFNANVNAADRSNSTPLHYAAMNDHEKVVEVLINNEADVNFMNNYNYTPVSVAMERNSMKTIELFSKNVGKNPLMCTAACGHLDGVKYFIKRGYDVNDADQNGLTSLHVASINKGGLHVVKFLIKEKEVYINAVDQRNRTPLNLAAVGGCVEIVKILLSNGARVNIATDKGVTPLHSAAKNGHKTVVEIMLSNEANINAVDKRGSTPLHYATEAAHKDVIKVLLENGAHINIKNVDGKTPLYYATDDSIKNILTLTKNLLIQVKKGDLQKVKNYINKGAVVNAQGTDGGRPLHYAAWKNYIQIVEVLLKNGANPNFDGKNRHMPLHYAALLGNFDMVQLLLDNGAEPNIRDSNGKSLTDLVKKKLVKNQANGNYQQIVNLIGDHIDETYKEFVRERLEVKFSANVANEICRASE